MFCHGTEAVPATVAGAKWHGTQVDGAILSLVIALPLPAKLVTFDLQNMHKWIGGPAHEWANLSAHGYCDPTTKAALAFFVDKKLLDHPTWCHNISQNGTQIKELWRADQDWKAESSHFPGVYALLHARQPCLQALTNSSLYAFVHAAHSDMMAVQCNGRA